MLSTCHCSCALPKKTSAVSCQAVPSKLKYRAWTAPVPVTARAATAQADPQDLAYLQVEPSHQNNIRWEGKASHENIHNSSWLTLPVRPFFPSLMPASCCPSPRLVLPNQSLLLCSPHPPSQPSQKEQQINCSLILTCPSVPWRNNLWATNPL